MNLREQSIYPVVMGTEEETRLNIQYPSMDTSAPIDALTQQEILKLSHSVCGVLLENSNFRKNGSKIYRDSYSLELCTPECSEPDGVGTYIKANSSILTGGIRRFAGKKMAGTTISYQRRVVDCDENTWGCHDNFSLTNDEDSATDLDSQTSDLKSPESRLLMAHLMTRNFITGSGVITQNGTYFSQKLSHSVLYKHYGYQNSLFRFNVDHGGRLEVRCNDINLKDWALLSRLGGMALITAALQSGLAPKLAEELPPTVEEALSNSNAMSIKMKAHNAMPINEQHQLVRTPWLDDSIYFQRRTMKALLDYLPQHEPIPGIYQALGRNILSYIDDMDAVLDGQPLASLADRADWAAKLDTVLASTERDRAKGVERYLGDDKSRATDMLYDRITIRSRGNGTADTKYGYGYRLAGWRPSGRDARVQRAIQKPPRNTRAFERVRLSKALRNVTGCDWHYVNYVLGNEQKTRPLNALLAQS